MRGVRMGLALLALATAAGPVQGQVSRADSAAVLLESARTFEARERWDVAEAIYRLLLERFPETVAGVTAREQLMRAPVSRQSTGRTELIVWSTLYGLWLGTAIPTVFDASGPEAYGVGLLLGGPAGFLTGRLLARSRPLSSGQARAITLGGTWGTWQGFGWAIAAEVNDGSEEVAAAVAGGLAGITLGTLLSRRTISDGLATTVNFGALWGTWFGAAGAYIADPNGDHELTTALLAGNAGLLATALLGPGWDLTRNRARLISIAGVIGGLGGLGLDLLAQPDDDRVLMLLPLAGSVTGLVTGALMTRGTRGENPGADGLGAFLGWNGEQWTMEAPRPTPVRIPVEQGRGTRMGWSVPLFRARF